MKEAKKYSKNYWDGIENMDMVDTNIFQEDRTCSKKNYKKV